MICLTLCALGCSESSTTQRSPTVPTPPAMTPPPTSSAVTCRTYPTAATVTMTRGALFGSSQLTGSFNSSANTATITVGACTTGVSTYRSTADFVEEIRVIPRLTMQTSTTTTSGGDCDSGTSTVNYVYDSQRRLVSSTTGVVVTTYTAWDNLGRPTAGSYPGTTIANTYNDSTRTWVQMYRGGVTGAGNWTTTVTYDANGAQTSVVTISGAVTETTTFNTTATAQVCK
jgi:YD repeat-containing protein